MYPKGWNCQFMYFKVEKACVSLTKMLGKKQMTEVYWIKKKIIIIIFLVLRIQNFMRKPQLWK